MQKDERLFEALNAVSIKIDTIKDKKDKTKAEIAIKKAIIEYCHENEDSPAETLDFLNLVLSMMNRETVTKGCVTHHLKSIKNKSDLTT
ncbi:hypothetical protein [Priestia aryabhattai]|uniref:hypothetical protein n=1 Tax=Priestia aryabhattai TaxID=412384 RepID=UPI0026589822|nr:hypothetical protein [Priestia aryabhattai]WKG30178.1 hypothetical protein QYS54_23910 [Priestia aryabhattai]